MFEDDKYTGGDLHHLIIQPEVHLLKSVSLVGKKKLGLDQGIHRWEPHLYLQPVCHDRSVFFPIKQFFVENIIFGILKIFQRKETKIGKHLARDKSVDQQCGEVDVAHHLIMMMMMMMIDY